MAWIFGITSTHFQQDVLVILFLVTHLLLAVTIFGLRCFMDDQVRKVFLYTIKSFGYTTFLFLFHQCTVFIVDNSVVRFILNFYHFESSDRKISMVWCNLLSSKFYRKKFIEREENPLHFLSGLFKY